MNLVCWHWWRRIADAQRFVQDADRRAREQAIGFLKRELQQEHDSKRHATVESFFGTRAALDHAL